MTEAYLCVARYMTHTEGDRAVQATKQQQIVGYFIEEAKEHLDTIEQGLLNLKATMADSEQMNELFRAAHSVKGGAAMLGFSSIQKVAHHLEDGFKILKESHISTDQQIEDLFLQCFDVLKALVEELQSPYGLQADEAERLVKSVEPTFTELQKYLEHLMRSRGPVATPTARAQAPDLSVMMNAGLKKMLLLFKQGDSAANRQQLAVLCYRMAQFHASSEWRHLLQKAKGAIGNSKCPYSTLAPVVIKELKQAGDLLLANRASEITPSSTLTQLAVASTATASAVTAATPLVSPTQASIPQSPKPAPLPQDRPASSPSQVSIPSAITKISIPAEPRAAARALLDAFNKEQLIEIAEFLMTAIQ